MEDAPSGTDETGDVGAPLVLKPSPRDPRFVDCTDAGCLAENKRARVAELDPVGRTARPARLDGLVAPKHARRRVHLLRVIKMIRAGHGPVFNSGQRCAIEAPTDRGGFQTQLSVGIEDWAVTPRIIIDHAQVDEPVSSMFGATNPSGEQDERCGHRVQFSHARAFVLPRGIRVSAVSTNPRIARTRLQGRGSATSPVSSVPEGASSILTKSILTRL